MEDITQEQRRQVAQAVLGISPADGAAVLFDLSQMDHPDAHTLGAALVLYPHIAPSLHAALDRFLLARDATPEEANLIFWGVHLMAATRDETAFPALLRLLELPDETRDQVLSDADTQSSIKLLIGTFNGDASALFAFIEAPQTAEWIRENALLAAAFLTFDGRIDPALMEAFLTRLHADRVLPQDDLGWFGWALAVGLLGLDSLAQAVRDGFADGLIHKQIAGIEHWEPIFEAAKLAPDDPTRFTVERAGYIEDLYDELRWMRPADDVRSYVPPAPVINPLRAIGRNDPCPCGSGRKFKKCCLNA